MRELSALETASVGGGLMQLAIYESTHLRSSSDLAAIYSDLGYTGSDSSASATQCSETTVVTQSTSSTTTSSVASCQATTSFPFVSCTWGTPTVSTSQTAGVTRTITCTTRD
ncbi:hypothetical protein ABXN37_20055 [Piscinibacter sakaiensis]|uniref:hypothetical protein n=1 Tax=Piscinibacter sakaiensis TaxID=1547922 RepID=UPI0012FC6817|nr:hypothetical protein [Piscinibacter sakaiensis]